MAGIWRRSTSGKRWNWNWGYRSKNWKVTGNHALKFPYAGYRNPEGEFRRKDENTAIWTANETDFNHAWHRDLNIERSGIYRSRVYKPWSLSARCVANHLEPKETGNERTPGT